MNEKRRSGLQIMRQLIVLVKPLTVPMLLAVILGVLGYLCAISITVLGTYALYQAVSGNTDAAKNQFIFIGIFAVLRGILHYGEQNRNHYIAFTLLAIIRDKVFGVMRRLAPAKMDVKNKGDLISAITSDIELLEVFYAHTISPICIAVLTCTIMLVYFASLHPLFILVALCAYVTVGAVIPLVSSHFTNEDGMKFRNGTGELSGFMLDSLRGLAETLRFDKTRQRADEMDARTDALNQVQSRVKKHEGRTSAVTEFAVIFFSTVMLMTGIFLFQKGVVGFGEVLLATVGMMSSFGSVAALSALSGSLTFTLAAGERILSLLEETPEVEDVTAGTDVTFTDMQCENICFAYDKENILDHFSLVIPEKGITGITGASGTGKSTTLKMLMRFHDVQSGAVSMSGENIQNINTENLRSNQAYVTQDTQLFHDTIENNIKIANQNAAREQVIEAAKKASIHDFIMTLPLEYETNVGELGELLSSGERQRIGLARAFLSNAPLILLDEPTSNLDTLNEGHILKMLDDVRHERSIVLVSHRPSVKALADKSYAVKGQEEA